MLGVMEEEHRRHATASTTPNGLSFGLLFVFHRVASHCIVVLVGWFRSSVCVSCDSGPRLPAVLLLLDSAGPLRSPIGFA